MTFSILGISGSLRQKSYNTAALRAAQELVPADTVIELAEIGGIPLYNEDLRTGGSFPPAVQQLRERIRTADALLFSMPEYNYSISGVLKNAIDWVSRGEDQPFNGKPAAVMGASPGLIGTARAQYELRKIGVFVNLQFINKPEVMIAQCAERFDGEGRLTHEKTRELIARMLAALRGQAAQRSS